MPRDDVATAAGEALEGQAQVAVRLEPLARELIESPSHAVAVCQQEGVVGRGRPNPQRAQGSLQPFAKVAGDFRSSRGRNGAVFGHDRRQAILEQQAAVEPRQA